MSDNPKTLVAAEPPGAAPPGLRRGLLPFAAALFTVWVLALATLVVLTANPPQINLLQLARSHDIVTAQVEDLRGGKCRVLKQWTPGRLPDEIRVARLSGSNAAPGGTYILPLVRDIARGPDAYRIVDLPERGIGRLIYPATPEVEAQLTDWQRPGD